MFKLHLLSSVVVICHTVSGAIQDEPVEASFIKRTINEFVAHGARWTQQLLDDEYHNNCFWHCSRCTNYITDHNEMHLKFLNRPPSADEDKPVNIIKVGSKGDLMEHEWGQKLNISLHSPVYFLFYQLQKNIAGRNRPTLSVLYSGFLLLPRPCKVLCNCLRPFEVFI